MKINVYGHRETGLKHVRGIWEEDGPQKSMSFIKLGELKCECM